MGAEKKKLVIAQLEAAGVRMTAWLSKAIDNIAAEFNDRDARYAHLAAGDKGRDAETVTAKAARPAKCAGRAAFLSAKKWCPHGLGRCGEAMICI